MSRLESVANATLVRSATSISASYASSVATALSTHMGPSGLGAPPSLWRSRLPRCLSMRSMAEFFLYAFLFLLSTNHSYPPVFFRCPYLVALSRCARVPRTVAAVPTRQRPRSVQLAPLIFELQRHVRPHGRNAWCASTITTAPLVRPESRQRTQAPQRSSVSHDM